MENYIQRPKRQRVAYRDIYWCNNSVLNRLINSQPFATMAVIHRLDEAERYLEYLGNLGMNKHIFLWVDKDVSGLF